jgi:hypothetical protein
MTAVLERGTSIPPVASHEVDVRHEDVRHEVDVREVRPGPRARARWVEGARFVVMTALVTLALVAVEVLGLVLLDLLG